MAQPTMQASLIAGEVSRALYGRVDLQKYQAAVALSRNFYVDYRGGASNRQGTEFIARANDSDGNVRVIPFTFNTEQTYALEFGHEYIRVIRDGGLVLEASKAIVAATQANPCVLEIAAHDWSTNDWIWVQDALGMTALNGSYYRVSVVDANHVSLFNLNGVSINSINYTAYTGSGTAARVFTLATPYDEEDLFELKYEQSADVMTITHVDYDPMNLTRTGHAAWTITAITFGPALAAPTLPTATPSTVGTTRYRYVITSRAANGVQQSLASAVAESLSVPMSTTSGAYNTIAWTVNADAQSYDVYRQEEIIGGAPDAGSLYGYVGSSTQDGFVDQNIIPDFSNTPPQSANPLSGNDPGCSTYFQQRQMFAGSTDFPQTIWASKSADFPNFTYSIPGQDDDAITNTLTAREVNAIKHMVPMTSLVVLTTNGAWRVDGGSQSDVITPSNFIALPQAYNGCSDVRPIVINYDILYIQAKGSVVRDLSYDFYKNIYTGADISILASHLFKGRTIVDWCWAEEPYKLLWVVRDDGVLLSQTFMKEQDIYAWAQHNTQGRFRSCCSITEGNEDVVYFVVERYVGGQYLKYIERQVSRNFNGDVTRAWFVDCGLEYPQTYLAGAATPSGLSVNESADGEEITYGTVGDSFSVESASSSFTSGMVGRVLRINGGYGTITAVNGDTTTVRLGYRLDSLYPAAYGEWSCTAKVSTITGLDHLEGLTVAILADGGVQPQQRVTNGTITLQTAAASIYVGLPYTGQLKTLPIDISEISPTIQGKRKTIPAVTLRLANSRGLKVGPDFNTLVPMKERNTQPYGTPIQLIDDDARINIPSTWKVIGQVCVQADQPLPATVLAFIPEVVVGDSA